MRPQETIIKTMRDFDALPKELRNIANEHGLGNVTNLVKRDYVPAEIDRALREMRQACSK